ncbi:hypothetical protein RHMOL_Rhmol04G0162900 [Rhododendron molle]|uniref:Uncharacterized protein n=1 Tax=Rhododendron molle TaxID=49168 RepID=A0ACC0P276_RHOML|nr:hypothetical protein RHMOL_Rhmol04G0162900 [Rhododendron molle]
MTEQNKISPLFAVLQGQGGDMRKAADFLEGNMVAHPCSLQVKSSILKSFFFEEKGDAKCIGDQSNILEPNRIRLRRITSPSFPSHLRTQGSEAVRAAVASEWIDFGYSRVSLVSTRYRNDLASVLVVMIAWLVEAFLLILMGWIDFRRIVLVEDFLLIFWCQIGLHIWTFFEQVGENIAQCGGCRLVASGERRGAAMLGFMLGLNGRRGEEFSFLRRQTSPIAH